MTIEEKRAYAREFMRRKRLDPVYRESELIKQRERFAKRDKQIYNQKRKEYRSLNLERFQNYEREYSRRYRAKGKGYYYKRLTKKRIERFVSVFINETKMFWKPKNQKLHYHRNDKSEYIHFQSLSIAEKDQLKKQLNLYNEHTRKITASNHGRLQT